MGSLLGLAGICAGVYLMFVALDKLAQQKERENNCGCGCCDHHEEEHKCNCGCECDHNCGEDCKCKRDE